MMATHNLSKPLNVFTPQAHKPTILNLHPNNVTILSSSTSGGNWRVLRQEMRLRDHLQPTETMGLSGPEPEVVTKRPMTRMCMCPNKRVPSGRSVKLEFLRGGNALSEALEIARLNPHLLNDAECEFKKILWQRDDQVQFENSNRRGDQVQFEDLKTFARRMEMSRKEDAAVIELLWYILKCKGSNEINDAKPGDKIYQAKLVLVEMLIYQGDYGRARQTLEELKAVQPEKDHRPPFYLAVIFVLLGKEDKEANEHWDEFNKKSEEGFGASPPDTPEGPDEKEFSQFKRHVKVLGEEIAAVRCK